MASKVAIVNLALTKLGAARISSLDDNSKNAQQMLAVYDLERLAELRKYRWSFALKRASIPQLAAVPAWGFAFQYQLPSDYVSLVQVNDVYYIPAMDDYTNSDNSLWAIESGAIQTDLAAPLKIRYIRDVTNEGEFDALFVESFASRLAYVTCEAITGSNTKKQDAANDYKQALRDALRINAIERPPVAIAVDSWEAGRL